MTKLSAAASTAPTEVEGVKVVVTAGGPYLLYGELPFAQQFIMPDKMGESWYYKRGESYQTSDNKETPISLCRCGNSANQPFCDGHHATHEWDSELTATRDGLLDEAGYVEGEELLLSDNEKYCCYARFCHPGGGTWRLTGDESTDPKSRKLAIREASMCPSARLMAWGKGSDTPYEFDFEPSVGLLEDPAIGVSGGIWLRGGIAVEDNNGEGYELRNRVVLCRCGASHNKPYCDGSHAAVKWSDGLPQNPDGEELPEGELEII